MKTATEVYNDIEPQLGDDYQSITIKAMKKHTEQFIDASIEILAKYEVRLKFHDILLYDDIKSELNDLKENLNENTD